MAGERALPGLGLFAFWTPGSNGWGPQNDENWLKNSVLTQPRVDTLTSTLPGSPSDGDIVLLADDAAANANEIAVRDNGAWVYLTAQEGWRVFLVDAKRYVRFEGAAWVRDSGPYDIRTGFLDTPAGLQVLDIINLPRDVYFKADFDGALGSVEANPTTAFTITVSDDGTTIGTISISDTGVVTFATAGNTPVLVAAGSRLTFTAQATADGTLEGGNFTIPGAL